VGPKWAHWSPKLDNSELIEVSEGHAMEPLPVRFSAEDSPVRFRKGGGIGGERRRNELRCGPSLVPVVESADLGEFDDVAHVRRLKLCFYEETPCDSDEECSEDRLECDEDGVCAPSTGGYRW